MQDNSGRKLNGAGIDRTFSWFAAVLLGLPGIYDLVQGSMLGVPGEALSGLGKLMCGVFFLLHALRRPSLQAPRAKTLLGALFYSGLAIAIIGFLLKRGII